MEATLSKIFIGLILATILFGSPLVGFVSVKTITATIDKVIIDNGEMYYAVTMSDGTKEVLANKDAMAPIKCNSNDVNMNLEVGKTYKFKVIKSSNRVNKCGGFAS